MTETTKVESAYIVAKDKEGNIFKINLADPQIEFKYDGAYDVMGGGGNFPVAFFKTGINFEGEISSFQLLHLADSDDTFEITDDELATLFEEGEKQWMIRL